MTRKILFVFCMSSILLLLACGTASNSNNSATPASSNSNSAVGSSAPAGAPPTNVANDGDKIGIPVCDDFIAKYEACITDKVPETVRAQYTEGVAMWRRQWKQLSGNPQTRGSLEEACKSAMEQARTQLKVYNCAF